MLDVDLVVGLKEYHDDLLSEVGRMNHTDQHLEQQVWPIVVAQDCRIQRFYLLLFPQLEIQLVAYDEKH